MRAAQLHPYQWAHKKIVDFAVFFFGLGLYFFGVVVYIFATIIVFAFVYISIIIKHLGMMVAVLDAHSLFVDGFLKMGLASFGWRVS